MGQGIKYMLDTLIISLAESPQAAYGTITFVFLYLALSSVLLLRDRQTMPIVLVSVPLILFVSALVVEAITK